MTEMREIKADACHSLQGPHVDPPAGFVPLLLLTEAERIHIEVDRPSATVGRHTGVELRFGFPNVSRRHCRFAFESGQWRVYDLNSTNGVYLNGKKITDATLFAGDRLQIGNVLLTVEGATPVRVLKARIEEQDEMLRQIADSLPVEATMRP